MVENEVTKYFQLNDKKCVDIFLPSEYSYEIVDESEKADICIIGVQHVNNDLLRKNEINILLNVENFGVGRSHYQFFNKYGDCNNPMVDIYIHNHHSDVLYNIDGKTPKILPTVDYRIQYFKKVYNDWSNDFNTPFEDKKFCLFVSANRMNTNKNTVCNLLSIIGKVDFITNYKSILGDKECVHGYHLMKFFNQYKFIICFENSHTNGYMTEKIFNVFHARCIPIYDGAPDIDKYINNSAYIRFDKDAVKKVVELSSSKILYERMIGMDKINDEYIIKEKNYLRHFI